MSPDQEKNRMVMEAIKQVENLCPQVINAAMTLACRPNSKEAQDNMNVNRDLWQKAVTVLLDAVDDITHIDDFLAVSEQHILEDITKAVGGLQESPPNANVLDNEAGIITGRVKRVCGAVEGEMDKYDPDNNTQACKNTASRLRDKIMPIFAEKVENLYNLIDSGKIDHVDDFMQNEFIEASRRIFDGVHDLRKAVLSIRKAKGEKMSPNAWQDVSEYYSETEISESEPEPEEMAAPPRPPNPDNQQRVMRNLPDELKTTILDEIREFKAEKQQFDRNVDCYEEHSNEIIIIAKKMCLIMMQMTDFTRGTGPLKTTTDVIQAAQLIAHHGKKLNEIAQKIAEACPDASTTQDLLAYLHKIVALCHQLNMCASVKAEVQENAQGEEEIVGIESATSLIQTAKNLMAAVVATVKHSYVASTQAIKAGTYETGPYIVWKMKAPEKKPLVKRAYHRKKTGYLM